VKTKTKTEKNQIYMKVTGKKTEDYTKYLQPSEYCESDNKKIKKKSDEIVKSIKGKKTDTKKANAILNWVQKNVKYDRYSGTHQGALGLLDSGKLKKGKPTKQMEANCADHAHLTIALLRAAKIPAQYRVNAYYKKDGTMTAHTWPYAALPNKKGTITWKSGAPTYKVPTNFGSKHEWNDKPLLKNFGHNTENFNIQVFPKRINKDQYLMVVSQTVTVDGKTKQTLFTQYSDKFNKK